MDSKIPKLERPQKRLRYFLSQERKSTELQDKQWHLQDIDNLFDDLDSPSEDELELPTLSPIPKTCPDAEDQGSASPVPEPSPLRDTFVVSQVVTPKEPKSKELKELISPTPDANAVTPFKEHGPIKTSSPIEEEEQVDNVDCCYGDQTASPLLFVYGNEEEVVLKLDPSPTQEVHCSGEETEDGDNLGEDSPPTKFDLLCKSQKAPCEENQQILEYPPQSVQCAVPQTIPQESSCPPVLTETQDTQPPCEPTPSLVMEEPKSKQKQKDSFAFLLKLKEANQPIAACSKLVPTVSEPPPEPFDDDFMILEDDGPCLFTIPRKTEPSKSKARAKQNKVQSSSSNKDASVDMVPQPDQGSCSPWEQEALERAETPAHQETKGRKEKAARRPVPSARRDRKGAAMDGEITSPERFTRPESLANQDDRDKPRPNKKAATKVSSKATSSEGEGKKHRHVGGSSPKPSERKQGQQTEEKAPKPSDSQRSRPATEGVEKPKKGRGKSDRGCRAACPGLELLDAAAEPGHVEDLEVHGGDSDLRPPSADPAEKESAPEKAKNKLPKGRRKAASKAPSNPSEGEDTQSSSGSVADTYADSLVLGKRKKRAPGAWWQAVPDTNIQTEPDTAPAGKKSKQTSKKTAKAAVSPPPVKNQTLERHGGASDRRPSKLPSKRSAEAQPQAGTRPRQTRKRKNSRQKPAETEVEVVDTGIQKQEELSPQTSPLRQHISTPSEKVFDRVYGRTPNVKSLKVMNHPSTPQRPHNPPNIPVREKRSLKSPEKWWDIGSTPSDVNSSSSPPRKLKDKNVKRQKAQAKQAQPHTSPSLRASQNGRLAGSPIPHPTAPDPPLKKKDLSAPKTAKRSLATFAAIFTSGKTAPPVARTRNAARLGGQKTLFPSQGRGSAQSSLASEGTNTEDGDPSQEPSGSLIPCDVTASHGGTSVCMDSAEELGKRLSWPSISQRLSDNTFKGFVSGPSSMINLEHHEEDEDMCLPLSRQSVSVLSDSELCGPPLRPLLLEQEDRTNLHEWLQVLWPTTIKDGGQITPEQFQWYSYRGRALGLRVDLQGSSFCCGRILLGSFMKKPLWVDHSFTSVFNVMTGCVSVAVNGKVSHYNPGQTFMVPCGHAYNIHNLAQEPAVLYFNRMQAESPE